MDDEQKNAWASPVKRIWAWVGVAYMGLIVLFSTYSIAYGAYMLGIGPLMTAPALVGGGATAIARFRAGQGRGGAAGCALVAGGCFLLAAVNLVRVLPVILEQL